MRWREVRGRLVSAAAALVAVGGGCTQDGAEARRGDDASAMAGADGADGVTVADAPEVPSGPTPGGFRSVFLEPPDLTTAVASDALALVLWFQGEPVAQHDVAALVGSVVLEDAAGDAVSFHVEVSSEPNGAFGPGLTRVFARLVPEAPLPAGWETVRLTAFPAGWRLASATWKPGAGEAGPIVGRVSPDDAPVMRTVTVCGDKVLLALSQPVKAAAGGGPTVTVAGAACARVASQEVDASVEVVCAGVGPGATLHVDLAGVASEGGAPAQVLVGGERSGAALDLAVDDITAPSTQGDGCRERRF